VKINVVLTLIEFGGLILIIVIGVGALLDGVGDVGNAFSTSEAKEAGNDVSLIPAALAGTALAFYALIGFEDSVNVAEEAKDPIRDYPRALFGGLLIAGTLYIVIGIIAPAVLSYATLTDEDTTPLLEIATTGPLAVEVKIFAAIGVLALINGALINMIMASRLTYGMARQRIVPQFFGKVHRRRQTPWAAILFTTGLAVILTATGDISDLAATTTTLLLIVFITVNISVLVLRRDPVSHEHFVAPTLLPAIGAVAALALLIHRVANDTEQITRALLLLGLGLVFWLANWVATRGNDEFDTGVITAIEHPERDEPRASGDGADGDPALRHRPDGLAVDRGAGQQPRELAPSQQAHVLPVPLRSEAPVRAPDRGRQPVRDRQQGMGLDRERPGRRLHVDAAPDPEELAAERGALLGRDVLDHRAAVDEVERALGERQAPGRVGLHERPRVGGPGHEVDAGDVEVGRLGAQPERPAPDVEDPRRTAEAVQPGEAEEQLVAAGAQARGHRTGEPGQGPAGGRVDVGSGAHVEAG
jgi:hypothetical protein